MLEEEQFRSPGRSPDRAKGAGNVGEQELLPLSMLGTKPQVAQPPRLTRAMGRASPWEMPPVNSEQEEEEEKEGSGSNNSSSNHEAKSSEHFLWAKNFSHFIWFHPQNNSVRWVLYYHCPPFTDKKTEDIEKFSYSFIQQMVFVLCLSWPWHQ